MIDVSRAMAAAQDAAIGRSVWDLDTPALCVDLERLDANIARAQAVATSHGLGLRPHAKTHKCAAIARRQLAAGALGICCAKVSEAEALLDAGIDRLCLTTSVPTPMKIRRAVGLCRRSPHVLLAVDHERGASDLDDAAREAGVVVDVVIDVAAGTRSGIPPGPGVKALAEHVDRLPHLRLRGLLAYDGAVQHVTGYAARRAQALAMLEPHAALFAQLAAAGHRMEIFSGGGTGTLAFQHEVPGFTEVQAGSYVFMDRQYLAIGDAAGAVNREFDVSLTVMTTVLNDRFPGKLTTDAGSKALTINVPTAGVVGEPGFAYNAGSDEFGVISYEEASRAYRIGDRLALVVPHCDPVVNLYDVIHATRNERVVEVWPIEGRGRMQ